MEEHAKLTDTGFQMTTDTIGDTYYVGPQGLGHTVWLYEDGTWRVEPDSKYDSLDEYLAHMKSVA